MEITFNADAAIRAMQQRPLRAQRAIVRTLNRTATSGRAAMATAIAQDLGIKASDAKAAIGMRLAGAAQLRIRLSASLTRLPLSKFTPKSTGRGVTYKIGRGGRSRLEHAFLATMASGHVGVFLRAGKKRLPIQEKFGPSIGLVFAKHRPDVVVSMQDTFTKNLGHEFQFAVGESS